MDRRGGQSLARLVLISMCMGGQPEVEFMKVQFFEVSGHSLESSHTRGFCMDFLEAGGVYYPVFLLSPLQSTVTH